MDELTKKLKHRIQTIRNKCICFCLQLDKLKHISHEVWAFKLVTRDLRSKQYVSSIVFKYFNKQCPNYLNEVFDGAAESNFQLRSSFQRLKYPFRNTNNGQYVLSYIGPTFWNQTAHTLKGSINPNTFKHDLKKYFLKELKNSNNSF